MFCQYHGAVFGNVEGDSPLEKVVSFAKWLADMVKETEEFNRRNRPPVFRPEYVGTNQYAKEHPIPANETRQEMLARQNREACVSCGGNFARNLHDPTCQFYVQ
jgi:hypothetical protein